MEAKPVDEDLRKLQSLLDDGVITESEFTEKKRQLLDQPALPATRAAPPGETPPPPKKIKAAPPAAPPTAPPANEPSLPLGYYELRDAGDDVIGYLVLSVWKSSGGFFGLMTLTSGEWEVEDYDGDSTTLLPVISSGSGPQRWSFDGGQFRFDLEEDASYSGTVSLRVLPNSGNLAVTWELESCDYEYDWSHRGEATAIPKAAAAAAAQQAGLRLSDTRSVLTGTATREHFDKGPCTAPPAATPPPAKPASIRPPPPPAAAAVSQPPKLISDDDIKKYGPNSRKALKARKAWASWDGTGTPPVKISGSFQPWEDAKFGELLNKYGQPKKNSSEMNDPAVKAFEAEFNYRMWASVVPHVNIFNYKEYKAWRIERGGKQPDGVDGPWVGFSWKQLVKSKAS